MVANPEKLKAGIPQTHRFRTLSHEECGSLLTFLEVYQQDGVISLQRHAEFTVLSRLAGNINVGLEENGPDILLKPELLPQLKQDDHVLVVYPKVSGMYVHIAYSRADEKKFGGMVDTGIVEPLDSKATESVQILCIASKVVSINERIKETKRVQASYRERIEGNWLEDEGHFASLLEEYNSEKDRLLNDPLILNEQSIKSLISKYQTDRKRDLSERRTIALTLQVEKGVSER